MEKANDRDRDRDRDRAQRHRHTQKQYERRKQGYLQILPEPLPIKRIATPEKGPGSQRLAIWIVHSKTINELQRFVAKNFTNGSERVHRGEKE